MSFTYDYMKKVVMNAALARKQYLILEMCEREKLLHNIAKNMPSDCGHILLFTTEGIDFLVIKDEIENSIQIDVSGCVVMGIGDWVKKFDLKRILIYFVKEGEEVEIQKLSKLSFDYNSLMFTSTNEKTLNSLVVRTDKDVMGCDTYACYHGKYKLGKDEALVISQKGPYIDSKVLFGNGENGEELKNNFISFTDKILNLWPIQFVVTCAARVKIMGTENLEDLETTKVDTWSGKLIQAFGIAGNGLFFTGEGYLIFEQTTLGLRSLT